MKGGIDLSRISMRADEVLKDEATVNARKEALSGKVETFDSVSSFMADLEKEIADDHRDRKEKSK